MSRRVEAHARLWPLRLLQLTPIIVFALAAAVWFAMPSGLRLQAAQEVVYRGTAFTDTPELAMVEQLDSSQRAQTNDESGGGTDPAQELQIAADGTTSRTMMSPWRLYDASSTPGPFAIAATDTVFEPLATFEAATGGRVAAFVIPPVPHPAVALSAVVSLDGLSAAERREYETSHTLDALRRDAAAGLRGHVLLNNPAGAVPDQIPMPVDIAGLTGDHGASDAKRVVYNTTHAIGGHIYELYSAYPLSGASSEQGAPPTLPDQDAVDTPANRRSIERLAKLTGGAVFVVGPTDAPLVPERAPAGMSRVDTAKLMRLMSLTAGFGQEMGVTTVTPAVAKMPGAGQWTASSVSAAAAYFRTSPKGTYSAIAPMYFIAFWDKHP